MANSRVRNRRLGLVLLVGVAGMVGLSFASVPLYKLFCQVTGYGGTPKTDVERAALRGPVSDQTIRVMFDANVNTRLEWGFHPDQRQVDVVPGVETLAIYRATNRADRPIVGTATFNVTPVKAAQYVAKMECFCFTEQKLVAGQEMPMPVSFYIDPGILEDQNTQDVRDIVLSYTFHPFEDETVALEDKDQGMDLLPTDDG